MEKYHQCTHRENVPHWGDEAADIGDAGWVRPKPDSRLNSVESLQGRPKIDESCTKRGQ